jgi:hypothetical protein
MVLGQILFLLGLIAVISLSANVPKAPSTKNSPKENEIAAPVATSNKNGNPKCSGCHAGQAQFIIEVHNL